MCEINLLKVFDVIHWLALLQENRVFQRLVLSLSSGDLNLLDQSGKDGLYHWARSSLWNAVLFFLNTHGCWKMSKTSIKFITNFHSQNYLQLLY